MTIRNYFLFFVFLTSPFIFAQKGIDPDVTYFFTLEKESSKQEVFFHFTFKDNYLVGNTSTSFFKVPIHTLIQQNNNLQLITGKIELEEFQSSDSSRKNKKTLKSFFNKQTLFLTRQDGTSYIYNNKFSHHTMVLNKVTEQGLYNYIVKHQWKVIQIQQENLDFTSQGVDLRFHASQNLLTIKDKDQQVSMRYFFDFPTNTVHFSKIENNTESLALPKSKLLEQTLEILNHQSYLFDVADQTLNLYKDDAIVMMLAKFTQED